MMATTWITLAVAATALTALRVAAHRRAGRAPVALRAEAIATPKPHA